MVDSFLMSLGFAKSKVDPNIYFKIVDDGPVILLLYVDDLFLTDEKNIIIYCKKKLTAEFEMKDLGSMHYFLGIEVWKSLEEIFLTQGMYDVEILKIFDMMDCRSMSTTMETNLKLLVDNSLELVDVTLYRQIIGSVDVSDEYQARYMLCCEHLESVSGGAQMCSPCSCKACDEIP
jgi:hypothetical protein